MKKILSMVVAVAFVAGVFAVAWAEPLVKVENGKVLPGLAEKWEKKDDSTVVFTLKEPKAEAVKTQLEQKLKGKAVVTVVNDKTIQVKGMPADKLYGELAAVDVNTTETAVAQNDDPFANIGNNQVALEVPDGSASLRARKKDNFDANAKGGEADAVFKAKIIDVKKGTFPDVELEVLVIDPPKDKDKKYNIARRATIKVKVKFEKVATDDPQFQTNVGANFLMKGDVAQIEVIAKEGDYYIAKSVVRVR